MKWLRRIKLGAEPFMTRWETSKYTDPLPGGKVRHVQLRDGREVDHHVARRIPKRSTGRAGGRSRGLAWSGRGRITRVDVSTDGGTVVGRSRAAHAAHAQGARALSVHVEVERR